MRKPLGRLGLGFGIGFAGMAAVALMAGRLLAVEGAYTHLRLFNEVLSIVRSSYVDEVKSDELIQGAYEGMLTELDPFSEYFTPAEYEAFTKWEERRRSAKGARSQAEVGLRVARRDGVVLVVAVRPGSDAEAKGITPGDLLRRVGDDAARELSLFQVESALSGPPGSQVPLEFARREEPRKVEAPFARGEVTVPPVSFEMADAAHGIAVVRIPAFSAATSGQFAASLERATKQKARRLLIDLRGNAWGTIDEAARTLGALTGDVAVGRLSGREGTPVVFRGGREAVAFKGPIGVLINGSTAQAAEFFAAGLADVAGASLMGETTFGIGAEQEMLPLRNGAWLRLSTRRYFSPSGTAWHGSGLKPGKVISGSADGLTYAGRMEKQMAQALEHLRGLPAEPAGPSRASAAGTGQVLDR